MFETVLEHRITILLILIWLEHSLVRIKLPNWSTTTKAQLGRAFAMIYQVPHATLF